MLCIECLYELEFHYRQGIYISYDIVLYCMYIYTYNTIQYHMIYKYPAYNEIQAHTDIQYIAFYAQNIVVK